MSNYWFECDVIMERKAFVKWNAFRRWWEALVQCKVYPAPSLYGEKHPQFLPRFY